MFNALNKLELRTLEEIRFLMGQFFREPLACLTLARYFITNAGDIARQHIRVRLSLRGPRLFVCVPAHPGARAFPSAALACLCVCLPTQVPHGAPLLCTAAHSILADVLAVWIPLMAVRRATP